MLLSTLNFHFKSLVNALSPINMGCADNDLCHRYGEDQNKTLQITITTGAFCTMSAFHLHVLGSQYCSKDIILRRMF